MAMASEEEYRGERLRRFPGAVVQILLFCFVSLLLYHATEDIYNVARSSRNFLCERVPI